MITAVLDADVLVYLAAIQGSNSREVQWDSEVTTSEVSITEACKIAEAKVEAWKDLADAWDVVLAFSDRPENNFRRKVHPRYKHNRSKEKPELYNQVITHMRSLYEWEKHPNLEGDDVMGLLLTSGKADVAVSTDKDLYTLPGHVIRVSPQGTAVSRHNSELEADRFWMTQVLTGDSIDGYLGCPGVGPKKAEEVLGTQKTLRDMWDEVVRLYGIQWNKPKWNAKFVTLSPVREALANARAARILRAGDYNYDTGEVNLWDGPA